MLKVKFVASIAERDVDLLLMEELSVSDEFREWLSSRIYGEPIYQEKIGAWHSVCDSELGESDLVFIFSAIDGVIFPHFNGHKSLTKVGKVNAKIYTTQEDPSIQRRV